MHGVAGLWSSSNVPGPHGTAAFDPPAQYQPCVHVVQPAPFGSVPGAQAPAATQMVAFVTLLEVPAAHAVHVRSRTALGVRRT
jgi:hypothetical protein